MSEFDKAQAVRTLKELAAAGAPTISLIACVNNRELMRAFLETMPPVKRNWRAIWRDRIRLRRWDVPTTMPAVEMLK